MTLSFAAILALVVEERVNARAGAILLWPALAIGLFSLLLWRWTDDLRLYFWVQFFPGLAVLLLFPLYRPKYTGTYYWIVAGVLYALAKLFEFTDGGDLFGRKLLERTHAQAPRGRGRMLRDLEIFPNPPADHLAFGPSGWPSTAESLVNMELTSVRCALI